MRTLEFNTREQELRSVADSEGNFFRSLSFRSAFPSEIERQPVDRAKFFTNDAELSLAVDGLAIQLVERDEAADNRGVIKAPASLLKPGTEIVADDIESVAASDGEIGARLESLIDKARSQRMHRAKTENWWDRFNDGKHFSYNPFQSDPTEQVTIGRDQIEPVTVYNFGEKLRRRHISGIVGAVAAMSALTDGYSRALSPYLVIHEAFLDQHFLQTGAFEQAAGRAWLGEPFIEARRSSFDGGLEGSRGQSWVSQLITHEISHQIDEEVSANYPDFSDYFHYVDENGDGLVDYVKPLKSASTYGEHELHASEPIRRYGYTNSAEDLATVGEEVPFGGDVDQLRRDAYLEIIEAFKEKGNKKYGAMQPLPEAIRVEVARGGEIQLPVAPSLVAPIRIRVDNGKAGYIRTVLKRMFG